MSNSTVLPSDTFKNWFSEREAETNKQRRKRGRKRIKVDHKHFALARSSLRLAYSRLRTWDNVADHYNLSKAAVYRIANDGNYRPSKHVLDQIESIGIPSSMTVTVDACPDCGGAHVADRCHGVPVEAVIVRKRRQAEPWVREAAGKLANLKKS